VYEQPDAGRRIGLPLFLVLVVLAGVAGTGAYFVARQVLANQSQNPEAGPSTPGTGPTTPTTVTTPPIENDPTDRASFGPAITEKAVKDAGLAGELQLLRYVAGAGQGGNSDAEAWVCRNSDGVLIYQGHRKTGPFNAATSDHTILLARGIQGKVEANGDEFIATFPQDPSNVDDPNRTDYHVAADAFYYVKSPSGEQTEYKIILTLP
jgi:hypothetical protein